MYLELKPLDALRHTELSQRVNGGFNGLLDREKYLKRAKFFLT